MMSFLRRLFLGGKPEELPTPDEEKPSSLDPEPAPVVDPRAADSLVDCSGVAWNADEQLRLLNESLAPHITPALAEFLKHEPFHGNAWCSAADGALLHAMAAHFQPGRIMEIGAGYTTMMLRHAKETEHLPGELISIDPEPRCDISELVDAHLATRIQDVPLDDFRILQPGEMVFCDTSHVYTPESDAAWVIEELLPVLPAGVLVGFHGVRLPRNYTREELEQGFSEQDQILQMLRGERPVTVLLSGGWLQENHRDALEKALSPLGEADRPTALWLRLG